MKKVMCVLCLAWVLALAGCGGSNEPCDYCNATPTKAYKTSQGHSYVCKDCSSQCFVCGEKATKHYENAFGIMTFMCDEDYQSVKALQ